MTHASVEIRSVSKSFGDFKALDDVSFAVAQGEFTCLLGPSGCGKTTLLRCLAGLETASAGAIFQDGQEVTGLPPSRRDFGIVFQSYALFPNLSVFDNIAFGLVNAGHATAQRRERVAQMLTLVGLQGQEHKFPAQLSGGQQQRVALARALAPAPGLLLLDEPLSALDAKVRVRLRREIRELQSRLNVTTLMVTHDQEEAQSMADRIVVMNHGRIEQIGSPSQVYEQPATAFVADFIGVMNFMEGHVVAAHEVSIGRWRLPLPTGSLASGHGVRCAVRPEHLKIVTAPAAPQAQALMLEATVRSVERLGATCRLHVRAEGIDTELTVDHPSGPAPVSVGQPIRLEVPWHHVASFDADTGQRLVSASG